MDWLVGVCHHLHISDVSMFVRSCRGESVPILDLLGYPKLLGRPQGRGLDGDSYKSFKLWKSRRWGIVLPKSQWHLVLERTWTFRMTSFHFRFFFSWESFPQALTLYRHSPIAKSWAATGCALTSKRSFWDKSSLLNHSADNSSVLQ